MAGWERRSRGDFAGEEARRYWVRLAQKYGVGEERAERLFARVYTRVLGSGIAPHRAEEVVYARYVALLERHRAGGARRVVSPGKVTGTMRLAADAHGARARGAAVPGKVTLTSLLGPPHASAIDATEGAAAPAVEEAGDHVVWSADPASLTELFRAHGIELPASPPSLHAGRRPPIGRPAPVGPPVVEASSAGLRAEPAPLAARADAPQVAPDPRTDWRGHLDRPRADAPGDARLPSGAGQPLPDEVRARMEAVFGHDFSHVRIHTDGVAGDAVRQMRAHAVTRGSHIYFGHGRFAPGTAEGDRLLLHELTHVVQADQGRLPSRGGLSSPDDPHEREAYAAESAMAGTLSSLDAGDGEGSRASTAENRAGHETAPPLLSRDADGNSAPARPPKTGPNVSEDALLGALPSVAEAPQRSEASSAEAGVPEPPPATAPADVAPESPSEVAPAPPEAEAPIRTPASGPGVRPPPSAAGAEPGPAPAAPAGLAASDDWAARARAEGAAQSARVLEAATAAAAAIRAAAAAEAARATAAFAEARARLEADAAAARTEIDARAQAARATIEAGAAALSTQLEADFSAREQTARGAVETARAQVDAGVEAEAQRAIAQSEARANRALALAEIEGGGEQPLAAGQRDIARRVANEVSAQCVQTGADAAAEVRGAGAIQIEGLDAQLEGVLATLAEGRARAQANLESTRGDSLATIEQKATEASAEVDTRCAEARATLDTRETELLAWLGDQAEAEAGAAEARAREVIAAGDPAFVALASVYAQVQAERAAALAETSGATPESVAEVDAAITAELERMWQESAAPQIAQAEQAVSDLSSQATAVADGFTAAVTEAEASAREAAQEQGAGALSVAARFAEACAAVEVQTQDVVQQGLAAELAEADRALAAQQADIDAAVADALGQLTSAVDAQLAWEDEQIALASERIREGHTQAASEYESTKAEAKARDEGETTSRGWLGDLWNFFDDLAQRTLEWFQEKLGRVWGNIIGWILAGIIYVVGVVVCAVAWLGAQAINLVWGFIWGETLIPGYGGGFFAFIADVIAGVLVYGDIRDIFKYWIWRPLWGEGPWWLNLLLGGIALLGLIPIFGDGLKALIKALKAGNKTALKWLAKLVGDDLAERIARLLGAEAAERIARRLAEELGEEAAERLIREIGAEAAEELLDQLGKDALRKLMQDLSGETIQRLVDEIGERALKKLAEELSGTTIERLAADLGQDALEKLLRTVGGSTIQELHTHLGKDALLSLLDGLRGVTIKEYLDALGGPALRNLAEELDGYAVKELMDALGARTLRRLADDLGGEAVQELLEDLGAATLQKLAQELGGTAIKQLADDLGAAALTKLARELGGNAIQQLSQDLTPAILRKLATDLGGNAIKQLSDDLTPEILRRLATDLDGAVVQRLARDLGAPALKDLAEHLSPTMIRDLVDELGKDAVLRFQTSLGADGLKTITDAITPAQLKAFVDELGESAIEDFGARALAEVGPHLRPTELLDLLTSPGTSTAFLRSLCEQAGAGAVVRSAAGHFGSFSGLGQILARAELHGAPAAGLKQFLQACPANGWRKLTEITQFFQYAASSGAAWGDLIRWGEKLTSHSLGNATKVAGRTAADPGAPYFRDLVDAAGNAVRITFNSADAAHVASRHTWDRFAVTPGNADLANSMLPEAITSGGIEAIGARLLQDPAVATLVSGIAPGASAVTHVADGAITYEVRVTLQGGINGMTTFYPIAGAGVETLSKDAMRAIIWLFKSI